MKNPVLISGFRGELMIIQKQFTFLATLLLVVRFVSVSVLSAIRVGKALRPGSNIAEVFVALPLSLSTDYLQKQLTSNVTSSYVLIYGFMH